MSSRIEFNDSGGVLSDTNRKKNVHESHKNDLVTTPDDSTEDDAVQTGIRDEMNLNNPKNDENFFVKYQGRTYELSGFFKKHPGGRRTLTPYKNLPLDKVLSNLPHSVAAFHLLEEFHVDSRKQSDDIEVSNLPCDFMHVP